MTGEPVPDRPNPPDPLRGFRGVVAATLLLEAIVVLLALLVLGKVGNTGGSVGVGIVLALAGALLVTVRFAGRPWATWVAVALQAALIACAPLNFALGAVGVLFGLVWFALLMMRRDVARKLARGELPSQRSR